MNRYFKIIFKYCVNKFNYFCATALYLELYSTYADGILCKLRGISVLLEDSEIHQVVCANNHPPIRLKNIEGSNSLNNLLSKLKYNVTVPSKTTTVAVSSSSSSSCSSLGYRVNLLIPFQLVLLQQWIPLHSRVN